LAWRRHGRDPRVSFSIANRDREMRSEYVGIGGFILLALNVWAIIAIVGSDAGTGRKVIWVLVILVLPLLGFIAWLIFGPRSARR
jgi:hypothetical protein